MKLTIDLSRWGEYDGLRAGRLTLVMSSDKLHVVVTADEDDKFDLDALSQLIDGLKRRQEALAHLINEEQAG